MCVPPGRPFSGFLAGRQAVVPIFKEIAMAGHPDARGVRFPDGSRCPALGLGTWHMGESRGAQAREVAAVGAALAMGYRVIDTAEMYGSGGAEDVVGQAVQEALETGSVRREDLFIVSKVLPGNASRRGTVAACEASLKRLGLEYLDLYLLHWRGSYPLADTIAAFESLHHRGLIRRWGVSNFGVDDMHELLAAPGGTACAANQVYYSLSERGIEFDLLPWQSEHGIPTMAYCPVDQGALASNAQLQAIARDIGCSAAQLALAWTLRQPQVMPIPKAVKEAHLRENLAALDITLDRDTQAALDRLYPPPRKPQRLAMT
jgi:diketogulonate reductase-like aldo/keto reductase